MTSLLPTNRFAKYKVNVPQGTSGLWTVARFEITDGIEALRCAMHGRPVAPGTYTRLTRKGLWDPVMSDTPAEVADHLAAIWQAEARGGRILLNGLGLGMVLKAILTFPNVSQVDVVEVEQDVINLVAPSYPDPRVHIVHADAFQVQWPDDAHWSVVWHDIWPAICSDNLKDMRRLRRKYQDKADWQGCWCYRECARISR